jgi:chromosome segregation ATPase
MNYQVYEDEYKQIINNFNEIRKGLIDNANDVTMEIFYSYVNHLVNIDFISKDTNDYKSIPDYDKLFIIPDDNNEDKMNYNKNMENFIYNFCILLFDIATSVEEVVTDNQLDKQFRTILDEIHEKISKGYTGGSTPLINADKAESAEPSEELKEETEKINKKNKLDKDLKNIRIALYNLETGFKHMTRPQKEDAIQNLTKGELHDMIEKYLKDVTEFSNSLKSELDTTKQNLQATYYTHEKEQIDQLKQKHDEEIEQINTKHQEAINSLNTQIEELRKKTTNEDIEEVKAQLVTCNTALEAKEKELETEKNKLNVETNTPEEKEHIGIDIEKLQEELKGLKDQVSEKERLIQQLQESDNGYQAKIQELQDQIDAFNQAKEEAIKNARTELETKISELTSQNEELQKSRTEALENVETINQQKAELEKQLSELQTNLKTTIDESASREEELKRLQEQALEKESKLTDAEQNLKNILEKGEEVQRSISNNITQLEESITQKEEEIMNLQKDLEGKTLADANRLRELDEIKTQKMEIEKQLQHELETKKSVELIEEQLQKEKELKNIIETNRDNAVADKERILSEKKAEIDKLNQEKEKVLSEKIAEIDKLNQEKEKVLSEKIAEIEKLKGDKQLIEKEKKSILSQVEKLKQDQTSIISDKEKAIAEISRLKQDLESKKRLLDGKSKQETLLVTNRDQAKKEITRLTEEIATIKSQKAKELKTLQDQKEQEIKSLQDKYKSKEELEAKLLELNNQIEEKRKELQEIRTPETIDESSQKVQKNAQEAINAMQKAMGQNGGNELKNIVKYIDEHLGYKSPIDIDKKCEGVQHTINDTCFKIKDINLLPTFEAFTGGMFGQEFDSTRSLGTSRRKAIQSRRELEQQSKRVQKPSAPIEISAPPLGTSLNGPVSNIQDDLIYIFVKRVDKFYKKGVHDETSNKRIDAFMFYTKELFFKINEFLKVNEINQTIIDLIVEYIVIYKYFYENILDENKDDTFYNIIFGPKTPCYDGILVDILKEIPNKVINYDRNKINIFINNFKTGNEFDLNKIIEPIKIDVSDDNFSYIKRMYNHKDIVTERPRGHTQVALQTRQMLQDRKLMPSNLTKLKESITK